MNIRDTETLVRHAMGSLVDSQGVPMADHCMRVANHFRPGQVEHTIGWLHDIVEDTNVGFDYLHSLGYSHEVIDAVWLLTHDKKEMDYPTYIDRICRSGNVSAIRVKIADQTDNLDPARWLGMGKYRAQALTKKWAGVKTKLIEALAA